MAIARLTVVFSLLGLATIPLAKADTRILEGTDAKSGEVPHMASVRLDNAAHCGGTIISERHILTAGHCVSELSTKSYDPARITARVGSVNQYSGGAIHNAKAIHIHPNYGNFLNDVAVIEVAEPFTWSEKVKPAVLPETGEEIAEGAEVSVSGWGLLASGASPYRLQHLKLHTISTGECEYRAGFGYDSVLCLEHEEHRGMCRGDDGAGATIGDKIVGVLSFAFGACGTKYPDVAAHVAFYREWLDSLAAESK